jgi:predicted DNA-binding transcriptional regulator YafY
MTTRRLKFNYPKEDGSQSERDIIPTSAGYAKREGRPYVKGVDLSAGGEFRTYHLDKISDAEGIDDDGDDATVDEIVEGLPQVMRRKS